MAEKKSGGGGSYVQICPAYALALLAIPTLLVWLALHK